jgi:hypothetical protein
LSGANQLGAKEFSAVHYLSDFVPDELDVLDVDDAFESLDFDSPPFDALDFASVDFESPDFESDALLSLGLLSPFDSDDDPPSAPVDFDESDDPPEVPPERCAFLP